VLVEGMQDRVLTDNEGRFELHLPRGSIMIRLERPGYGSEGPNSGTMHLVNVEPGMPPMTLFMTPAASIVAHVVLSTGDPPDGIDFSLYHRTVVDGHAQWTRSGNAVADSGGTARFFSLDAPGAYVFCSNSSPDSVGTSASIGPAFGYPSLCFPGGTDFASATASPLMIRAGQQVQLEADLPRQPYYPVTISVSRTPEGQMPSVQVFTQGGQSAGFGISHGVFTIFYLPNGNYYAEAALSTGKGPDPFRYGRVDFTVVGGPVSGLSLALLPVQPISVEIHREYTAAASQGAGSYVINTRTGEPAPPLNLSLIPADNLNSGAYAGGLRRDPSAPYGDLFQLPISQPGRFWVRAFLYGPSYISSILCGGVDLAGQPLVVGPGGTSYPIEITLRNDMGRLTIIAAPPSPAASAVGMEQGEVPGILIYAIPLFPTIEGIHQWAAQDAPFNFSSELPPGDYVIVASSRARDFDLDDPREMARLTSQGQKVTVEPGGTATVVLSKLMSDATEAGP
jgi:hypothetical protein